MELVELILSNPIIRSFIIEVASSVVGEIFHRRSVDPAFLAKSDAVFAQLHDAKTYEEKKDAQKTLQSLMSGY